MPNQKQNRVRVVLRIRPTEHFANEMIEFGSDHKVINIYNKKPDVLDYVNNQVTDWSFKIDGILNNVAQETVYNEVVHDLTVKCLDGYNGTVLCYGQTGAGKTFTMTGATENYQQRGLIPRTIQHIFKDIQNRQDYQYTVRIGYLEIYNEQIYDLLAKMPVESDSQMSIVEDQGDVFVKGLSYVVANNEEEALNLLFEGETNRAIGQHILNKVSSRSHCIFQFRIECKSISASNERYVVSKLNLVDLAGSERLAKTQSQGITQKEAQYINKSLSFLEQAVIGLSDSKKQYVQFRQCKLTHLLKDSIGGKCMTAMVANIWPEARHMEETVSTLRFSSRMMNVPVEPAINEVVDPLRMIKKMENEVKLLRQELHMHDTLANRKNQSYEPLSEHQLLDIENNCRKFVEGSLDELDVVNLRQVQATFTAFKRICKQLERDTEGRLRKGYTIDKTEQDQSAEAMKAALLQVDDGNLVGDMDGSGFGIGTAPKDLRAGKADILKATKLKRLTKTNTKDSSPIMDNRGPQLQKTSGKDQHAVDMTKDAMKKDSSKDLAQAKEPSRPSTPPPKSVAFEEFKLDKGSEINRILNENKEILTNKRHQYSELAHKINETKAQIDETRMAVERKRTERLELGEFVNEFGETVIDEEEFGYIKLLQDLKSRYRDDYEKWRDLKSEITYCTNMLEQCRQRLIQDAAERFERMQKELQLTDIESVPYRAAKIRSDRRHVYENAISQYPSTDAAKPGAPKRYLNNPPPGKLAIIS